MPGRGGADEVGTIEGGSDSIFVARLRSGGAGGVPHHYGREHRFISRTRVARGVFASRAAVGACRTAIQLSFLALLQDHQLAITLVVDEAATQISQASNDRETRCLQRCEPAIRGHFLMMLRACALNSASCHTGNVA